MIRFPNISFEIGEIARAKVRFFFSNFLVNFIVEQLSNKNRQTKTRSIPIWTIFTVKSYFHLRDENYCKLIIVNFFTNSLSQLSLIALLTRWLWTRDKYLWRKIDDSSKIDKYILKSGIRYSRQRWWWSIGRPVVKKQKRPRLAEPRYSLERRAIAKTFPSPFTFRGKNRICDASRYIRVAVPPTLPIIECYRD